MFSFFEEIAKLTGLPFQVFNNNFKVINFGNNAVYVESYKNIITFTSLEVSIKLSRGVLKIFGKDLKIKNINASSIIIVGDIRVVEIS